MYHACYLFRVPNESVPRFLKISSEASTIYRHHGADASGVMCLMDGASKYGCVGLFDLVQAASDEMLFLGIDSFRDAHAFHASMKRIDADPRIGELYREMKNVVDLGQVIRWEAEDAII